MAAVAGANLPIETALLMGFSNLIADGISMGLGDYLSSKAEMEYQAGESKKELLEFDNSRECEVAEQEKQFEEQGMSKEDAAQVTAVLSKYPAIFHAIHLPGELGFGPPDADDSPAMDGFVSECGGRGARPQARRPLLLPPARSQRTPHPPPSPPAFLSFLAFGSVPMWSYVITFYAGYKSKGGVFGIACAFTALTMFLLGVTQATITKQNRLQTGVLMTLNGSLAAASAFLVGWGLEQAIGSGGL